MNFEDDLCVVCFIALHSHHIVIISRMRKPGFHRAHPFKFTKGAQLQVFKPTFSNEVFLNICTQLGRERKGILEYWCLICDQNKLEPKLEPFPLRSVVCSSDMAAVTITECPGAHGTA